MSKTEDFTPTQQIVAAVVTIVVATVIVRGLQRVAFRRLIKHHTETQ